MPLLLWDVTRHRLAYGYRRFGTYHLTHRQQLHSVFRMCQFRISIWTTGWDLSRFSSVHPEYHYISALQLIPTASFFFPPYCSSVILFPYSKLSNFSLGHMTVRQFTNLLPGNNVSSFSQSLLSTILYTFDVFHPVVHIQLK
jgi:hypothetical protein